MQTERGGRVGTSTKSWFSPRLKESSLPDTRPAQIRCPRLIILINTWYVSLQQHTYYLSTSHHFKLKFNTISDAVLLLGLDPQMYFCEEGSEFCYLAWIWFAQSERNLSTASLSCSLCLLYLFLLCLFTDLKDWKRRRKRRKRIWDGGQENASSCLRVLMSFSDNWYWWAVCDADRCEERWLRVLTNLMWWMWLHACLNPMLNSLNSAIFPFSFARNCVITFYFRDERNLICNY